MVGGPHLSQRYIRALIKPFLNTKADVFMLVINFPTYILALQFYYFISHLVHCMSYLSMLICICDQAGPSFHYLREFCQMGNNNNIEAPNPTPLDRLNQRFQNYHSALLVSRYMVFVLNYSFCICRPWGLDFLFLLDPSRVKEKSFAK